MLGAACPHLSNAHKGLQLPLRAIQIHQTLVYSAPAFASRLSAENARSRLQAKGSTCASWWKAMQNLMAGDWQQPLGAIGFYCADRLSPSFGTRIRSCCKTWIGSVAVIASPRRVSTDCPMVPKVMEDQFSSAEWVHDSSGSVSYERRTR